jgi:phospholipase/carboxylesterase
MFDKSDPHKDARVYSSCADIKNADAAMILVHGRGADAADILSLTNEFSNNNIHYLAPEAAGGAWYPYPFLAPIQQNEPHLTSALLLIKKLVENLKQNGIPGEKIFLLGFSQGACLTLEFAARNLGKYAGIIGLSGGLIGDRITEDNYSGSMESTPVFLGCSDIDFHIPKERVDESTEIFKKLNAEATKKIYPNMGHTINEDEINFVRRMLQSI